MRAGLWFAAGAGAGIYAVFRGRRAAETLSVAGLGDRMAGLAVGARMFRDEVAAGRAEKETELRQQLAVAPGARSRELTTSADSTHPDTTQEDRTDGHR